MAPLRRYGPQVPLPLQACKPHIQPHSLRRYGPQVVRASASGKTRARMCGRLAPYPGMALGGRADRGGPTRLIFAQVGSGLNRYLPSSPSLPLPPFLSHSHFPPSVLLSLPLCQPLPPRAKRAARTGRACARQAGPCRGPCRPAALHPRCPAAYSVPAAYAICRTSRIRYMPYQPHTLYAVPAAYAICRSPPAMPGPAIHQHTCIGWGC